MNSLSTVVFANKRLSHLTAATWKFLHDGTAHTIMFVGRYTAVVDFNGFMGTTASATTEGPGFDVLVRQSLGWIRHGISTAAADNNVVENQSANSTLAINTAFCFGIVADPSNGTAGLRSSMREDGGAAIANNAKTTSPSASNPLNGFYIGRRGGTSDVPLNGEIAELVIYNSALGTTDRQALEDYLAAKWGTP